VIFLTSIVTFYKCNVIVTTLDISLGGIEAKLPGAKLDAVVWCCRRPENGQHRNGVFPFRFSGLGAGAQIYRVCKFSPHAGFVSKGVIGPG
jgi:hypothetical protein